MPGRHGAAKNEVHTAGSPASTEASMIALLKTGTVSGPVVVLPLRARAVVR